MVHNSKSSMIAAVKTKVLVLNQIMYDVLPMPNR